MKRTIFFNVMTVAFLAFSKVAVADLTGLNDPSIVGNGNAPQDGNNLTRDTETGLEWLDLTLSIGRSYNDVAGEFEAGGAYEGFRFATSSELETLFLHAGVILEDPGPVTQPYFDFLSLIGSVQAGGNISPGRYDDQNGDPTLVGTATVADNAAGRCSCLATIHPDDADFGSLSLVDERIGAWLVRPSLSIEIAVLLSWPVNAEGYVLQWALDPTGPWEVVDTTIYIEGTLSTTTVSAAGEKRFFRLFKNE